MPSVTQSLQGEALEMVMLRCRVLRLHHLLPRAGARAQAAHCSFPARWCFDTESRQIDPINDS